VGGGEPRTRSVGKGIIFLLDSNAFSDLNAQGSTCRGAPQKGSGVGGGSIPQRWMGLFSSAAYKRHPSGGGSRCRELSSFRRVRRAFSSSRLVANFTPRLKRILLDAGCRFERQGRAITRFGRALSPNERLRSMVRSLSRHTANAVLKQAGLPKQF
jgi:hypothetical protein